MATPHTSKAEPELDDRSPVRRVHVLLPLPLGMPYDYGVARGEAVEPGDFVTVPLGKRAVNGVVWGEGPADPGNAVPDSRLRPIAERLDVPPMAEVTRRFITWLADYTCASPGAALRMTMSVRAALEAPRPRLAYALAGPAPKRMTRARTRVMKVLADGLSLPAATIAELAAVGAGVVRGLAQQGTLREVRLPAEMATVWPGWMLWAKSSPPSWLATSVGMLATRGDSKDCRTRII